MATNKGKKYMRLTGLEVATPENLARANEFLKWYGNNTADLKSRINKNRSHQNRFCPDLMGDTMLSIYDAIAYKGADVKDYIFYFYRSYYNLYLAGKNKPRPDFLDDIRIGEDQTLNDTLEAPDFDYYNYEIEVDALKTEILDYVRARYNPVEVSLFEIYVGLYPDTSYKRISALLGIPFNKVWASIGAIRKDVAVNFSDRRGFLLSYI